MSSPAVSCTIMEFFRNFESQSPKVPFDKSSSGDLIQTPADTVLARCPQVTMLLLCYATSPLLTSSSHTSQVQYDSSGGIFSACRPLPWLLIRHLRHQGETQACVGRLGSRANHMCNGEPSSCLPFNLIFIHLGVSTKARLPVAQPVWSYTCIESAQ